MLYTYHLHIEYYSVFNDTISNVVSEYCSASHYRYRVGHYYRRVKCEFNDIYFINKYIL